MKSSLVVTTINHPTEALIMLAEGALKNSVDLIIVGDTKTPSDFKLSGSSFFSYDSQLSLPYKYSSSCPTKHYCRKNIGYLIAMSNYSDVIIETDDDNLPYANFWTQPTFVNKLPISPKANHVNIYQYFSDESIWPRGFPLELVNARFDFDNLLLTEVFTPIIQGLANTNPDVDAIYRLTSKLPIDFVKNKSIALDIGSFCPFNSQNTTWSSCAFPLLYLPAYCSFRMTDIWRSFVAQRIAFEYGWSVLFMSPTVWQDRNEHNLMSDFIDEIPGYKNNLNIVDQLCALSLDPSETEIISNLRKCYELFVALGLVDEDELKLLELWNSFFIDS